MSLDEVLKKAAQSRREHADEQTTAVADLNATFATQGQEADLIIRRQYARKNVQTLIDDINQTTENRLANGRRVQAEKADPKKGLVSGSTFRRGDST